MADGFSLYPKKIYTLLNVFAQRLGDVYEWNDGSKACFVALAAMIFPMFASLGFTLHYVLGLIFDQHWLLVHLSHTQVVHGMIIGYSLSAYMLTLSVICTLLITYEVLHKWMLWLVLFFFAMTESTIYSIVGFFDGVTWLVFLIHGVVGFVFLKAKHVYITAAMMALFMLFWSLVGEYLPFEVRTYLFTRSFPVDELSLPELLFSWAAIISPGMACMIIFGHLMSAWRHREADLRSKSYIDDLTSLLNRRAVMEGLKDEYFRAKSSRTELSVAILDLDHFKSINDNYGHLFGDEVLTNVSMLIRDTVRKKDLVGRYGGEEFIIIFPECGAERAHQILEGFRESLEKQMIKTEDGHPVSVTVSVGVAALTDNESIPEIIDRADQGLYRAKDRGRNRVEYG